MVAGEAERKPAPTASDVEHAQAGLEAQLGRDVRLLGGLSFFQAQVAALEVGAGVLQILVQEASVEVEPEVVVVMDVPRCATAVVDLAQAVGERDPKPP
jgi:hypothetical protein